VDCRVDAALFGRVGGVHGVLRSMRWWREKLWNDEVDEEVKRVDFAFSPASSPCQATFCVQGMCAYALTS